MQKVCTCIASALLMVCDKNRLDLIRLEGIGID
jgi:hypothetical protein